MKKYYLNIVFVLLLFIDKTWSSCILGVLSEFGTFAPLLLNETDRKVIYPQKPNFNVVKVKENDKVVANCPETLITISGTSIGESYAILTCVGDTRFIVPNGEIHKFKDIQCSSKPKATTRTIGRCSNGHLIQIGFNSIASSFIPIVDVCYNKDPAGTFWAHSAVPAAILDKENNIQKGSALRYRTDEIPDGLNVVRAYVKSEQRKSLLEIMSGNQLLVDKYIPKSGTTFFARGLLVRRADQFYRPQQYNTNYHINALPIWQCINDGNLKMVENEIRKLALITGDLDVYTGGLYTLQLPFSSTDSRDIYLAKNKITGTPSLFVPRLLFKLAYNRQQKRAIVYITVNNPFLTSSNIPGNYIICREYKQCSLKNQPTANYASKGYTYCCLYHDFINDIAVQSIGLPSLSVIGPLFL